MKRLAALFTLLTILMAIPLSSAAADKTRQRLDAGEIVISTKKIPGSDIPQVIGMMVVDAPPQPIWRLLDRCGDYKRTMQRVKSSKELWRKGNKVRCELVVDMPAPMDDLRSVTDATHTVTKGEKWVRSWELVEGDYTVNNGSWTLVHFDEKRTRTLVIYKLRVVPNTSVPDMVKRLAQKKALPKALEHLRSRFRSR